MKSLSSHKDTEIVVRDRSVRHRNEADDDEQLIRLWLHGKSDSTQEAYERDLTQFLSFVDEALNDADLSDVTLRDLQDWSDELFDRGLAQATIARKLSTVKSLFSFGQKIGYFVFNVGAAIKTPTVADDLAERILDQEAVQRLLEAVDKQRDRVLIRLFYASGGRVSELNALRWRSATPRKSSSGESTGQIMVRGKGDKNRSILLSPPTWNALTRLREAERSSGFGGSEDPVFRSRKGGVLSRQQIWRIVKEAARAAGLSDAVSPHWLRHAHASHSLDEGAPVHLVKETLGHKSLATTSRYTHAKPDDSSSNYLDV